MKPVQTITRENIANEVIEINLSRIVSFIRKYYIHLIIAGFLSGVLGYAYSYTLTKIYESKTILLPEFSNNRMGQGISAILGFSAMEGGSEAIRPDLYPSVLRSKPFAIHMLSKSVTDQNGKRYASVREYLKSLSKPGLFSSWFDSRDTTAPVKLNLEDKNILNIDRKEEAFISLITGGVEATYETKTGIISIVSKMPDPVVAAQMSSFSSDYLIEYMTDYRTKKSMGRIAFLEKSKEEAWKKREKAERVFQAYRDSNRNIFLNTARIQERHLEEEFQTAHGVYMELVRQTEQAKVNIREDIPVFKVLDPAQVPLQRSSPRRLVIALISAILGSLVTFTYIFVRNELAGGKRFSV